MAFRVPQGSAFDYSAEVIGAGGPQAERNWDCLIEHTLAEWSSDLDATMATMVPDDPYQVMHATGMHIRGAAEVRAFYAQRMKTFEGQGFVASRWVVSDRTIVGEGMFLGRPKGDFFGVKADGRELKLPMSLWIDMRDGLIQGEIAYLDGAELMRQLRGDRAG